MNEQPCAAADYTEGDFERYLVHDRHEILAILEGLRAKRGRVMLSVDGVAVALTVLLAVNPEFEEIVFDCGMDPENNRRIMRAERLTMAANVGGIKVQFSTRGADATVFEGLPALRTRLPDIVLRLQRREFYRIPASLSCETAVTCEGKVHVLEMRVADLSLGGVALVTDKTFLNFEIGSLLENCVIVLESLGALSLVLRVMNVYKAKTRKGQLQLRVGCEFASLTHQAENLISLYIGRKERARRMIA